MEADTLRPTEVHVYDWLESPPLNEGEAYAKMWLDKFTRPAAEKLHNPWSSGPTLTEWLNGHTLFCDYEGKAYRCIGASRLGDVWLTADFDATRGYQRRVDVSKCSNWRKVRDNG